MKPREAAISAEPDGIVLQRVSGKIRVGNVIAAPIDVVDELPEQRPMPARSAYTKTSTSTQPIGRGAFAHRLGQRGI